MLKIKKPCPKCKALNEVTLGKNIFDEDIEIIHCRECGSLSGCRDGIHWNIVVENNPPPQNP